MALNQTSGVKSPFALAFLTDFRRAPDPARIIDCLPAGTAVIFRDYETPDRAEWAQRLTQQARSRNLLFYVAGDEALARRCGADGLHLPAFRVAETATRPADLLLSVACHSENELTAAAALKPDSLFLSPVFATISHPGAPHLGAARFRALAREAPAPVLALGGVTAENAPTLRGENVAGFGAIGAFTHD